MRSLPDRSSAAGAVCAVVVTFHPDDGLASRLDTVVSQVAETVIVDNGAGEGAPLLRGLARRPGIALIENGRNLGIARALNIGIRHALDRGCAWALLLDQDTEIDGDAVDRLLAVNATFPEPHRLAVIGSRYRDPNRRPVEPSYLDSSGADWDEVESVITSGSLVSLALYTAIGPFRDDFFIDYVDTEYCFRARAAGYRIIETRRPLMSHTVGAPTRHRLLWATRWTTNHSPDRRYYMARNNTVLLRQYGTTGRSGWFWKSLVRSFRLCKRIAYFEQGKARKIAAVAQGWWDGVRGNMGQRGSGD